ncbi:hypothetical protein [Promicromonospora iranensis]|uniref:Uncharacterized protein n=1 Tax=Promicromonospora iranensis TaxID=1105144 RepID=A0ABU2CIV3_9MICO|nr:hypothetical protein [Promicromonospora iranensis]MDR7381260.1 hypothetical protein [Promicromonospora iranensis]
MDERYVGGPAGEQSERLDGGFDLAADLIMGPVNSDLDLAGQVAAVMDRLALDAHLQVSAVDRHWQIAIHLWPALKTVTSRTGLLTGSLVATGVDADMLAGVGPHPHYPRDPRRHLTFHAATPPTSQWPHQDLPGYGLGRHGDPGRYDLVLLNLAFHDAALLDPDRRTRLGKYHREVLASALERTTPGGLTVALTSPVFLDHPDSDLRRAVAERADLVGAVRLPAGAMRPDSHAEGPTDVVLLHHRRPGQPGPGIPAAREVTTNSGRGHLNEYWLDNPDHVLGHLELSESGTFTVRPGGEPLGRLLQAAFDQIASNAINILTASPSSPRPAPPPGLSAGPGPTDPGSAPRL